MVIKMEHQMECIVCGTENSGFVCPVCGYMSSASYGDDVDFAKEIERADEYRAGMLARVRVKIPVYSYKNKIKMEDRQLLVEEPDIGSIELEGCQMKLNQPIWFSEEFCNQERDLELNYEIVTIDGKSDICREKLENPGIEDETWKIGMILRPELKIQLIVGNEKQYSTSSLHAIK